MASAERRIALVTGSNRGTGQAIATALHERGYRIVSLNRTLAGEGWLGEIQCDLARPDEVLRSMTEVAASVPSIDLCVLNAAVRRLRPVLELPLDDWLASVSTNLTAPFLVIQQVVPMMRPGGLIIVLGSHAGSRYFEGGAAYCATKAALKALVEVLLLELRRHGLRTVLVSPGAIANREWDNSLTKMSPESVGRFVATLALDTPPDIAVGEVEIRPSILEAAPVTGLDRLQRV
jgi:NAD(P)-dependent dehydrogenase (short-subunit alcohol dehydrogenase family)